MDHFQRVIRLLFWLSVGFYLGGYATYASAETIPATFGDWKHGYQGSTATYPSAVDAAQALVGAVNAAQGTQHVFCALAHDNDYTKGVITAYQSCFNTQTRIWTVYRPRSCPATYTLDGANCIRADCAAGQVRDQNGQCIANCVAGSSAGYYSTGFGTTACINGCSLTRSATGSVSTCSGWSDATGWASCYLAQSGATCSVPSGSPSSSQSQCPVGQCPGTVNGVQVCVPCTGKTDIQSTTKKTTTAPDGTSTTTTTTNNTTTNNNTITTTTTISTTTTPSGGTPSTTTQTESNEKPKDAFCIENPDSPLCKNSSFGGSCGSFSCDGDAIQCAMAREQHQRNCTMFETETSESTLGRQAVAGTDPQASNYPNAPGKVEVINLSTAIDTTNPIASGCLSDKQIAFTTFTVTLPFSVICPYIEFMGQIVLAFSLLAAARIAFSGV